MQRLALEHGSCGGGDNILAIIETGENVRLYKIEPLLVSRLFRLTQIYLQTIL
jgi:hypothetical protein